MTPSPLPSVLVVPARPDPRGHEAAAHAAQLLVGLAVADVADPADLTEPGRLAAADHVVVLDPGHLRAHVTNHPALTAPARARDRLALLRLLRDSPGRVRWVGRPEQWEQFRDVLLARSTTTPVSVR
ncbi:hypothetical protein [Actinomycetospora termitidis]|uniref:Uncharacterized protein n=1 Tax=Actinomycetospora termitidis TaxID=3053470 RepID=A0ABT7M822_9PSEU|nr:hypothetical protein [Actinomycetospora sp. Odt1-22]MDL5156723.1 hypothetical protein [Actinomycetospora sp. Odt1-22]